MVRVGHPARLVESVLGHSLDAWLSADDSAQIVRDVRLDMEKALVRTCGALLFILHLQSVVAKFNVMIMQVLWGEPERTVKVQHEGYAPAQYIHVHVWARCSC